MKKEVDNFQETSRCLKQNVFDQSRFAKTGTEILARLEAGKMDDQLAFTIRQYVNACAIQVRVMHERRRELTDRLIAIRQRFVELENSINPKQPMSPAYQCEQALAAYLRGQAEAVEKQRKNLEKQYTRELKKVCGLTGVTEEERQMRMEKLVCRTALKKSRLRSQEVETELIPQAANVIGYIEIFKFWWERSGQYLSAENLDRIFHPMLMFAKAQARKGTLIQSEFVTYQKEPKLRRA